MSRRCSSGALLPNESRLPPAEQSDHNFYEPIARNIVGGRGVSLEDGSLATQFLPGYPVILAGLFEASSWSHISEASLLSLFSIVGMASIRVVLSACFLVVMVLGIVWVGGEPMASRLESMPDEIGVKDFDKYARTDRSTIWPMTWEMIKDHPFAGVVKLPSLRASETIWNVEIRQWLAPRSY